MLQYLCFHNQGATLLVPHICHSRRNRTHFNLRYLYRSPEHTLLQFLPSDQHTHLFNQMPRPFNFQWSNEKDNPQSQTTFQHTDWDSPPQITKGLSKDPSCTYHTPTFHSGVHHVFRHFEL